MHAPRHEAGFSFMEAIIGTLIAIIAIVGLAQSFGIGRALITRYEIARAALAAAQARMEVLSAQPLYDPDLTPDVPHPVSDFTVQGAVAGTETWRVEWYDDPLSPTTLHDMRRVTVSVAWGAGAERDSVTVSRLFLR